MKLLNLTNLFLFCFLALVIVNDGLNTINQQDAKVQREFSNSFQSAVDDTAHYLSRFEAQQLHRGIRYSKEKELELDMEMLNVFYDNLALKFGVEGNPTGIQNIMLHIPAMVIVRYDGYNLVTLDDKISTEDNLRLEPYIWPIRPYNYTLDNGCIIYFTLDDNLLMYDPNTNQYFEGVYDTLRHLRDFSPLDTKEKFNHGKKRIIAELIENDLSGAINKHLELTRKIGLRVDLSLPKFEDFNILDIGFFAFVQGYPLPGGELLNSYAFGGGAVIQRREYIGVIREDGRHVAYDAKCGVPAGSSIIETIFNDEEAARKGYYIQECP